MKIEFDLPKFEKEISINIIIRKDGEVVETFSESSASPSTDMADFVASLQKQNAGESMGTKVTENKVKELPEDPITKSKGKTSSGNFMDPSLF